jgi:hypothetical protein
MQHELTAPILSRLDTMSKLTMSRQLPAYSTPTTQSLLPQQGVVPRLVVGHSFRARQINRKAALFLQLF